MISVTITGLDASLKVCYEERRVLKERVEKEKQ